MTNALSARQGGFALANREETVRLCLQLYILGRLR